MMRKPELRLTAAAAAQLQQQPRLLVELELLFSCLVRKQVRFPAVTPPTGYHLVSDHPRVDLLFRPVVTRHCRIDRHEGPPPTDDLPLAEPDKFTPRWVALDYRNGRWYGDFGYAVKSA